MRRNFPGSGGHHTQPERHWQRHGDRKKRYVRNWHSCGVGGGWDADRRVAGKVRPDSIKSLERASLLKLEMPFFRSIAVI